MTKNRTSKLTHELQRTSRSTLHIQIYVMVTSDALFNRLLMKDEKRLMITSLRSICFLLCEKKGNEFQCRRGKKKESIVSGSSSLFLILENGGKTASRRREVKSEQSFQHLSFLTDKVPTMKKKEKKKKETKPKDESLHSSFHPSDTSLL